MAGLPLAPGEAQANKDDALKILKDMSDYVAGQKTISATFDASIEVVTPELEKIQYTNSGQILLARPNKLRASRIGGYADVELVFDGQKVSILGKNINAFTQIDAQGTTDQMYDLLRNDFGMQMPAADLLLANVFEVLTRDVIVSKHIGAGVIGGVECEHLAFRNDDVDWQIWVQTGSTPIPRKLVITTKSVTGAPQYTLVVREWKTTDVPAADAFTFKAPAGATQVKLEDLTDVDELPAGVAKGVKQ
jgi:hypothetical protein